MRKLILSIVLPLTMVCCQSENNIEEVEVFEEPKEAVYNCLYATVFSGEIIYIEDHWNNTPNMDGHVTQISNETSFHHFCFDENKYTFTEMLEVVEGKYPLSDSYTRGDKIIKRRF